MCALPLALAGFYERNNRVPQVHLMPRVVPNPNAETWFLKAYASYVPPPRNMGVAGGGVDLPFEEVSARVIPTPYTAQYNRIYPLARKTAFLRANAVALANLRRGLQLPYAYSLSGYAGSDTYWSHFRLLTRLLLVEAHARAQQSDWDGAADSLLDAYRLVCVLHQEAPLTALHTGYKIRTLVRRDFWALSPYLSARKSRDAARKIEKILSQVPSFALSLTWEKRCRQEMMLRLIEQGDFRLLYTGYPYACADLKNTYCSDLRAIIERDKKALPQVLQMQLVWMNKPQLMAEMTRHLDWEIAQAKKPFPQRIPKWPDPIKNDEIDLLVHPNYWDNSLDYARGEAQDALLATSLALRAFRLEKGRNPRALAELVPRYLARVPLDPFSNGQPLRYKNQSKRFLASETYEPIYASAPSQFNRAMPPSPSLPSGFSSSRLVRQYETLPFTLYSLGHNARDDGGTPYEDPNQTGMAGRYKVDYLQATSIAADIVAGINN